MTEKLRLELDARMDDVPVQAIQGNIRASQVWRALYLEDPRVFEKREEVSDAGFSVDILIDASSSRKNSQEQIAAQAYILAKSLDLCGIPLQVYSYCSIRGYTVLRLFQSYGENRKAEEVFSYVAAGNNRDGLALRGAGHLMAQSEQEKKLLLVLTDGSPQDDQIAAEGAFYKNREYTDQIAVEDHRTGAAAETEKHSGRWYLHGNRTRTPDRPPDLRQRFCTNPECPAVCRGCGKNFAGEDL